MARARESDEGAFDDARRRAVRRVDLLGELLRYGLVCGLLWVFAPPIGWAVAFFWGIGLARRSFGLIAAPRLGRGWTERELERAASKRDPDESAMAPPSRRIREAQARLAEIRIEDVVDSALAARADRIAQSGIELRRETDAPGALLGDPVLLERALADLLDRALDDLEARDGRPRLGVEVGENLAGTEAWVRIRGRADPASQGPSEPPAARVVPALARRLAEALGGTLEECSSPATGFELLLTLPKQGPRLSAARVPNHVQGDPEVTKLAGLFGNRQETR